MGVLNGAKNIARVAFERLPEPVRADVTRRRIAQRQRAALGQIKDNQAMLALRLAEFERAQPGAARLAPEVDDPRFPDGVRTRLCTQDQWQQPWFAAWCEAMGERPTAHRKTWEFAYIAHVLDRMGMLAPGRRGLGFGVGREPLVPAFAARGAAVVATDLAEDMREAQGWMHSGQHALGADGLQRPEICDPATFERLVSWRPVDMRDIPSDVRGFDFCWSACALEHLGSLEEGWRFLEASLETLVPGGIAVHTTEYNLSFDDRTIAEGPTVLYRERDVRELMSRLESAGHEVAAFDTYRGTGVLDEYVDVPPYGVEPVLRFRFAEYTLTSVAVVVRTAAR